LTLRSFAEEIDSIFDRDLAFAELFKDTGATHAWSGRSATFLDAKSHEKLIEALAYGWIGDAKLAFYLLYVAAGR